MTPAVVLGGGSEPTPLFATSGGTTATDQRTCTSSNAGHPAAVGAVGGQWRVRRGRGGKDTFAARRRQHWVREGSGLVERKRPESQRPGRTRTFRRSRIASSPPAGWSTFKTRSFSARCACGGNDQSHCNGLHWRGSSAGRGDRLLAHQMESVPNVLAVVRDLFVAWEHGVRFAGRAALALGKYGIRRVGDLAGPRWRVTDSVLE